MAASKLYLAVVLALGVVISALLHLFFSDLKFCGVFWFKELDLIGSASFEPLRLSVKVLSVDFRVLPSLQSFSGFAQPPLQLFAQH